MGKLGHGIESGECQEGVWAVCVRKGLDFMGLFSAQAEHGQEMCIMGSIGSQVESSWATYIPPLSTDWPCYSP